MRKSGILNFCAASNIGCVGARLREIIMHGISSFTISSKTVLCLSSGMSHIYDISPAPKSWIRFEAKFLKYPVIASAGRFMLGSKIILSKPPSPAKISSPVKSLKTSKNFLTEISSGCFMLFNFMSIFAPRFFEKFLHRKVFAQIKPARLFVVDQKVARARA